MIPNCDPQDGSPYRTTMIESFFLAYQHLFERRHEKIVLPYAKKQRLFKQRIIKALIRLRGCAG